MLHFGKSDDVFFCIFQDYDLELADKVKTLMNFPLLRRCSVMNLCGETLTDLGRWPFYFSHQEVNGEEERGPIVIFGYLRIVRSRFHASSL
ncbi:hypothetical protein PMIT1320_00170 [Prochlorococcus marinus str. MIT 1320]|nr:hypothetical protein PMIT1320_00170 [Prochlorococcus marinus str. MIT 1320]